MLYNINSFIIRTSNLDNTKVRQKRAVHTFLMQTYRSISKPPEMAKEAEFYGVCTDSSVCVSNIFGVRWCEMIWPWMELWEGKICSVHSWNTYCAVLSSSKCRAEAKVRRGSRYRAWRNASQRAHLHNHRTNHHEVYAYITVILCFI